MIQNTVNAKQYIYVDYNTQNKSFIDMHRFLKDIGIQNNAFFLVTLDPGLLGVNPRDPRLNTNMRARIMVECRKNFYYFLREIVRIPDQGGTVKGGVPYKLHRGNLALNYCFALNYNIFIELPRQHGKTIAIDVRCLWEFLFGTTNSEMMFVNKKHDDAKLNLTRLKEIRETLPDYLQMNQTFGFNGKKIKPKEAAESITNPINGNKIKTMPAARNRNNAMSLGRGCTQPRQWYDEFAFILHNKMIYQSATPAYKTASQNAKNNGAPYGIVLSTTPGDMTTEHGIYAFQMKEDATDFNEKWYDMTKQQLDDLMSKNTKSSFVYIKFSYQQLGSSEEYFKEMVKDLGRDWATIRREVLLEWSTSSDNCPFTVEDLNRIKLYLKEPIKTVLLLGYYQFNIYEEFIPDGKHTPIIGVDVAGGYQQDASAITIIDSYDTRVKATMNCNYISIPDLTKVIYELVTKHFPNAVVNIERTGGFGASVISALVKSRIKKNLYYEIKDRTVEESFTGGQIVKSKKKTKVYGLDETHHTREMLCELLNERVMYHKDKFICPLIHSQLETMEVKKKGRWEHADNAHDDQIFSYLMALYVYYYGKDIMERWGVFKTTIKTDVDEDEGIMTLEEEVDNVLKGLEHQDKYEANHVQEQLDILNQCKAIRYEDFLLQQTANDEKALKNLLDNNPLARKAYERTHADVLEDYANGVTEIPPEMFMTATKYIQEKDYDSLSDLNNLF